MFAPIASWGAWHSWCVAGQLAASASLLNSWNESSQIRNLVCNISNYFSARRLKEQTTTMSIILRLVTQPGDTSSSSTVAGSMSENHRNFLVTQLPPRTSFKSCIFSHHNEKPPVRGFLLALEWREQLSSLSFSLLLPDKVENGNAQEKGKEYPHSYFESWNTIGSLFFFFFFFTNGYPFTNGTWD